MKFSFTALAALDKNYVFGCCLSLSLLHGAPGHKSFSAATVVWSNNWKNTRLRWSSAGLTIVTDVAIATGPALLGSRGPLCETCSLLNAWVDIII